MNVVQNVQTHTVPIADLAGALLLAHGLVFLRDVTTKQV